MFILVENSELAYFMTLSLANLMLSVKNEGADQLGLEILGRLLTAFLGCKEDDPEEYIERLYKAIINLVVSLGY